MGVVQEVTIAQQRILNQKFLVQKSPTADDVRAPTVDRNENEEEGGHVGAAISKIHQQFTPVEDTSVVPQARDVEEEIQSFDNRSRNGGREAWEFEGSPTSLPVVFMEIAINVSRNPSLFCCSFFSYTCKQ